MRHTCLRKRIVLVLVIVLAMFLLCSCMSPKREIGNHRELGEQFVNSIIGDDYDTAYALIKNSVSAGDFSNFWESIQPIAAGAETFEIEQIGWRISTANGLTTSVTAHRVYLDNGKTVLFQVITRNDIAGLAGVHFSDITNFTAATDSVVSPENWVLLAVSILVFAFVIWMFVDCQRRKPKHRVLWTILILGSVAIFLTVGKTVGVNFSLGLMFRTSTIVADPALMAVSVKLVIPVGAIVYLCLRKKLKVIPTMMVEPEKVPTENVLTEPENTNTHSENSVNENPSP